MTTQPLDLRVRNDDPPPLAAVISLADRSQLDYRNAFDGWLSVLNRHDAPSVAGFRDTVVTTWGGGSVTVTIRDLDTFARWAAHLGLDIRQELRGTAILRHARGQVTTPCGPLDVQLGQTQYADGGVAA